MNNWRTRLRRSLPKGSGRARSAPPIPCVFLAYGEAGVIDESLRTMIAHGGDRIRIAVIHNPSGDKDADAAVQALCMRLLDEGRIESIFAMDVNISNNAIQLVLETEQTSYRKSDHIVVTDGDVLLPEGALDELLAILARHTSLFACGLRMDATRWSDELSFKNEYIARFMSERHATADYINSATGMWFAMFRTQELYGVLEALRENSRRFTDGNLKRFAQILLEKSWAATRTSLSRELNRERRNYYAVKTPGTTAFEEWSPEGAGSRYAVWNHDRFCGYTVHRRGRPPERVDAPASTGHAARRYVPPLDDDLVVSQLAAGKLAYRNAYLQPRAPKSSQPKGLYFVLAEKGASHNGIPRLWGNKSVIFMSDARRVGARRPYVQALSVSMAATLQKEALTSVIDACASFVAPGGRILVPSLDWEWLGTPEGISRTRRDASLAQLLEPSGPEDERDWLSFLERRRVQFWTGTEIVAWAGRIGASAEIIRTDGLSRRPYLLTHVIKMPEAAV